MRGHSDDWIQNRILWWIQQNKMPAGHPHLYESLPNKGDFTELFDEENEHTVGRPVIVFLDGKTRWTLLGTGGLITQDGDSVTKLSLDDLEEICQLKDTDLPKDWQEYLEVKDRNGGIYKFWAPSGPEFFIFYGILLKLRRMRR